MGPARSGRALGREGSAARVSRALGAALPPMDMFGRFAYADSEEKAEGGSPLDPADAKRVAGAGEAEPEPDASLLPSGPAAEAIAANADVKLHRKTNYVRRRMKRLRKKHLFDGKKASRRGKAPKGKDCSRAVVDKRFADA